MDWDQMEGEWEKMKASARERWAKFTDDDLKQIAGKRDQMIAKLQEKYGISRDEAFRRAEEWLHQQGRTQSSTSHSASRRYPSASRR